ncbi:hypothetical protein CALVIDRAFT_487858 [Calocera viscosa TUFC12733]|uniref:RRM domain-containing protein n=1 Tax=Calocera viscosa (strain TUFC12733) TaxID=1330018 RepID=A0A167I3V7_CALVF|nr:hypothetical protein CALVIDRAFT_487858 [Calocera viscosa TUFC12733]
MQNMQNMQNLQNMQTMQNMQGMNGMQGMMGMNNGFGQNVGLGMGMGMGFGGYGYDLSGMGGKMPVQGFYGAQGGMLNPLAGAPLNPNQRTVYIGNLPSAGTVDELLSLVRSTGPIESVRLLPEKNCAFVSFLDAPTALGFFNDASVKKLQLHGMELKIGWGKATPVPPSVGAAVMQYNASRNVYLGGLDDYVTEEMLRDDLGRFGPIDQIKILKDKNVGFVHFLSVQSAIKAVSQLSSEPNWQGKRVNYGKDRCTYVPKGQQGKMLGPGGTMQNGMQPQQLIPAATLAAAVNMGQNIPFNPAGAAQQQFMQVPGQMSPFAGGGGGAAPNMRTVYLGNIHPDTTAEDLCNAVRGGVLQSIRYMKDKHIAFVTFIDPAAALGFFNIASIQGLSVNNRRLKIGWGKSSNPLPPALAVAVQGGATRNVYVGNIDDWEKWSEERLKRDFGEFGDIELINSLREKNCAWVNFTNISSAMKAIEAMRIRPEYAHLRVSYGKDRCANPPRAGVQGGGSRRNNTASSNAGAGTEISPISASAVSAEPGELAPPIFQGSDAASSPLEPAAQEYEYVYDDGLLDADEADAREAEHDIIVPSDEAAAELTH